MKKPLHDNVILPLTSNHLPVKDTILSSLTGVGNPKLTQRPLVGCLFSNMELPILVRQHFYTQTGPRNLHYNKTCTNTRIAQLKTRILMITVARPIIS